MQYIGKRDSLDKARQGVSVAELEKRYRTANETALEAGRCVANLDRHAGMPLAGRGRHGGRWWATGANSGTGTRS